MKLCKDCKNFIDTRNFIEKLFNASMKYGRCKKEKSFIDEDDLYIRGIETVKFQFAGIVRIHGGCGKDAKLFEDKYE